MPAGPVGKDVVEFLAHDSSHGPAEAGHVVAVDGARAFNHGGVDTTAIVQNQEMCGALAQPRDEYLAHLTAYQRNQQLRPNRIRVAGA